LTKTYFLTLFCICFLDVYFFCRKMKRNHSDLLLSLKRLQRSLENQRKPLEIKAIKKRTLPSPECLLRIQRRWRILYLGQLTHVSNICWFLLLFSWSNFRPTFCYFQATFPLSGDFSGDMKLFRATSFPSSDFSGDMNLFNTTIIIC
jgi:hypothetical protein